MRFRRLALTLVVVLAPTLGIAVMSAGAWASSRT
jgi:hypothetical protein